MLAVDSALTLLVVDDAGLLMLAFLELVSLGCK